LEVFENETAYATTITLGRWHVAGLTYGQDSADPSIFSVADSASVSTYYHLNFI
jgi:hypothetical protein